MDLKTKKKITDLCLKAMAMNLRVRKILAVLMIILAVLALIAIYSIAIRDTEPQAPVSNELKVVDFY